MSPRPNLESFPRPDVTVDLAIITVTDVEDEPALRVLVQERTDPDGRVLPGAFLRERATVTEAVADVCSRKVGVEPSELSPPRLLRLFDGPDRDDRTWAISVAHSVSVPESSLTGAKGELVAVTRDGELEDGSPLL